jgi:hypothetical protein
VHATIPRFLRDSKSSDIRDHAVSHERSDAHVGVFDYSDFVPDSGVDPPEVELRRYARLTEQLGGLAFEREKPSCATISIPFVL